MYGRDCTSVGVYICAPLDCECLRTRDKELQNKHWLPKHFASIANSTMGVILGVHVLEGMMLFFDHGGDSKP